MIFHSLKEQGRANHQDRHIIRHDYRGEGNACSHPVDLPATVWGDGRWVGVRTRRKLTNWGIIDPFLYLTVRDSANADFRAQAATQGGREVRR